MDQQQLKIQIITMTGLVRSYMDLENIVRDTVNIQDLSTLCGKFPNVRIPIEWLLEDKIYDIHQALLQDARNELINCVNDSLARFGIDINTKLE